MLIIWFCISSFCILYFIDAITTDRKEEKTQNDFNNYLAHNEIYLAQCLADLNELLICDDYKTDCSRCPMYNDECIKYKLKRDIERIGEYVGD